MKTLNRYSLIHPKTQQKFMEAGRKLVRKLSGHVVVHNSKGEHLATVYRMDNGKLLALTTEGQDITDILTLP